MSYYNTNYCNSAPVEYYQDDCPYCQVENFQFDNYQVQNFQNPNVIENFDFFGWWPWMPKKKCSCPPKDKKWYNLGSLWKSSCPKGCRYNQCESCPKSHYKQKIHVKNKN
jgi:hypothetical protein